jgi:t-SNARE complex subunit (syntaxin)
MARVEDKIDQAFDSLLKEIGEIKLDVRKGNMAREQMSQRLTDLEMQVIESRQHLQVTERAGVQAAQVIADTAVDTAKAVAKSAPRNVWRTKLGMVTAGSAAFVAVVAFFTNLPKFVRGSSELAVALYSFIVHHR